MELIDILGCGPSSCGFESRRSPQKTLEHGWTEHWRAPLTVNQSLRLWRFNSVSIHHTIGAKSKWLSRLILSQS